MLYLIQDINGHITFPPHIWNMMKEYVGVYDISTSWKKLKTLPLGTFENYSQPTLPPSKCSEEFKILRDKNIKANKRKIMVLKSWMCKKQKGFWELLFKELDDRVVKKNQIKQQLDDYIKPYNNAKYIVLNLDDDNQKLCFGILKVSKITKTKITGNIIVSKNYKYKPHPSYRIVLLCQTNYIDSVTIGKEVTLYVKGCNNGVNEKTNWRMKDTNGNWGDINNMKCIEREDMSYYVTRENITPTTRGGFGLGRSHKEDLFTCCNIKALGLGDFGRIRQVLSQDNEFNRIKMYYDKSYNRTNVDFDWMFENR